MGPSCPHPLDPQGTLWRPAGHRGAHGSQPAADAHLPPLDPGGQLCALTGAHAAGGNGGRQSKFVYLSVDGGKAFSLKNGDVVRTRQSSS